MKRTIYFLIAVLFAVTACKDEQTPEPTDDKELQAQLLGEWSSTTPAEGYFKIRFKADKTVFYTLAADTENERVDQWPYTLPNSSTLRIHRLDRSFNEDANFDHTLIFNEDGTLTIRNIQKDLTQVVGRYAGDNSIGYHDVTFQRDTVSATH